MIKYDAMSESDQVHSLEKASTLVEALPYIREHRGKIIVIKYGGHAMTSEKLSKSFAQDISLIREVGIKPIIVHGGGPQIEKVLKKRKIKSDFIDGLRITTKETVSIVADVLEKKVNKKIVKDIKDGGGKAISLLGNKKDLIRAKKIKILSKSGKNKDIGFVGYPVEINTKLIHYYLNKNYIPVISPIGKDGNKIYNINADTVAGVIAEKLKSNKIILLTDISGVMNKNNKLIPEMKLKEAKKIIKNKHVKGGMRPKIETCIKALNKGVNEATILDGRIKHAIILELFTIIGVGTQIKR